MKELNRSQYGMQDSVHIPDLPKSKRQYGKEALSFIRDCCEDLKFDAINADRQTLIDSDGKSAGKKQIPFNMERDLDRLSFETAVGRFLASGAKEDAFDIYYCYCEIFKPFGAGYDSTGLLLELLSEHESNASSLLMKHRDHYSHSVYVFLIGLAMYKNHAGFRTAYNMKFGFAEGKEAACHFLEFWGLASLFHDIGYPFEIAHQQMKAYVCKLDKSCNDDYGFAPYVSYPERLPSSFQRFDFIRNSPLTFEAPNTHVFRNLILAFEALHQGGNMPCILNAANEIAVEAFLQHRIPFLRMPVIIEKCMNMIDFISSPDLSQLIETDRITREVAQGFL